MSALPKDQSDWLPISEIILAGQFDKSDKSTLQSIAIGLRLIPHPKAQEAMKKIKELMP